MGARPGMGGGGDSTLRLDTSMALDGWGLVVQDRVAVVVAMMMAQGVEVIVWRKNVLLLLLLLGVVDGSWSDSDFLGWRLSSSSDVMSRSLLIRRIMIMSPYVW